MTEGENQAPSLIQNVIAENGFAYGVIGADIHVFANGLPLYLLANWQPEHTGNPDWLRELPSRMLNARRAVVPFTGRDDELAELRHWRDSGPRLAVHWLYGPGGEGKTRLAGRLAAESASAGWKVAAAFHGPDADMPKPGSQDMRLADVSGLLMIVDYADRWRLTNLTWLLKNALLHQPGVTTRVLMVARTADSWPAVRGVLDTYEAVTSSRRLPVLGTATGERTSMFTAALNSFAAIYQLSDAESIAPPGSLDDPEFGLTLALHMAALVAVDAHATGQRPPSDTAGLSMYLLDREQLHWARLYADDTDAETAGSAYQTPPEVMNRTVFTAALTGAVTHAVGTALLRDLQLSDPNQTLQDHGVCYPSPDSDLAAVLEPLYPDRLAEDFLALTMPGHVADYPTQAWAAPTATNVLARRGDRRAPAAWTPRAITFLASAALRWPHLGPSYLHPLLRRDPQLAIDAGSAALSAIANLPSVTMPVLEAIETRLPDGPHVDLDTGIAALAVRLAEHRLTTRNPAARSRILDKLGVALTRAGMYEQALPVAQEAVDLKRRLARTNPFIHEYNLASALDNLGVVLSNLGRAEEASAASEEAVETRRRHAVRTEAFQVDPVVRVWRRLTSAKPPPSEPASAFPSGNAGPWWSNMVERARGVVWAATEEAGEIRRLLSRPNPRARIRQFLDIAEGPGQAAALATSLTNQAGDLWETGHREEALALTQEAVEILRRLGPEVPASQEGGLALSLHNLGMMLSGLGREEEALEASEEAVHIWRRLARSDPAVHEPNLALALTNHSTDLPAAGRYQEALAAAEEAVELRRRLARANQATHEPGLATSLLSRGMRLDEVGRHQEALTTIEEAVGMWRRLAQANPAAHEPRLAAALTGLAGMLEDAGRREEALAATRQAVQIQRRLAKAAPAVHEASLAASLTFMASLWDDRDQAKGALAVATEAVNIHRRLARSIPAAHEPALAGSLTVLTALWSDLDQAEKARAAAEEAVEVWRRLAKSDPAHEADLARSLNSLGIQLSELDRPEEALVATEEVAGIWRRLAASDPACYPDLAEILENLHINLAAVGRSEEARAAAEEAVGVWRRLADSDPAHEADLARSLNSLGIQLSELDRPEEALAAVDEAAELSPEAAEVVATRGKAYQVMGRREEAVADFTRAIELDPELAWAIAERGETYRLMGRHEDAVTDLTRAIELIPDAADVVATRGQAYQVMGRREEAVADLTRAIELDPELAWAIAERGETYRLMGRHEDAVTDLTRAIELIPDAADVVATRGQAYRALCRREEAVTDLTRAIELDPELAWAIAERGETYRLMGRHEDAVTDLTRAIELDPEYSWAIGTRGQAYRALCRREDAVADFTRAIELNPKWSWTLIEQGNTYLDMGRYEDAIATYDQALVLDPSDVSALNNKGVALFALSRPEEALAVLDYALSLDPDDSNVHGNRGIALAEIGDFDRALAELDAAERLAPTGSGEAQTWAGAILWHQLNRAGARERFASVMGRVSECTPFYTATMEAIALCGLGQPGDAERHLLKAVHLRTPGDNAPVRIIYDLLSDPPLPGIERLRTIADNDRKY